MKSPVISRIYIIVSMVIFGSIGVFIKFIGFPSSFISMCRGLLAFVFMVIFIIVRKKGFMFRAEIYRKAIAALDKLPATDEFTLIPGEYYTRLEQELLAKLKVKISGKNKTSPELTSDRMGFLKASSIMEQYTAVKNHILAQMALDKNLDYDDFCVVVGTDESLARCAAYYSAAGFHCISSASVPKEDVLLDNLNLISYTCT